MEVVVTQSTGTEYDVLPKCVAIETSASRLAKVERVIVTVAHVESAS